MKPKINRYQDLIAWQFADELADVVDRLAETGGAARNHSFQQQILKSSAKAPAQIAEGFLRFKPREAAYYYRIARASLGETMNHLRRGFRRGYWPEADFQKAWKLATSAFNTTGGLLRTKLGQIEQEEQAKQKKRTTKSRPS